MRAMAVTSYGAPLTQIDVPEPELLPGRALLEIWTSGVCFSDVKTSRGLMPFSEHLLLPHVPGHEIYGRVLASDPAGAIAEGTRAVVYHYWSVRRLLRVPARGRDALRRDGRLGRIHPLGRLHRADRGPLGSARPDPRDDRSGPRCLRCRVRSGPPTAP